MVKVISLSEAAYRTLLQRKKPGMSFSDVVLESAGKDAQKTETHADLLAWVKERARKFKGKKENVSENIDKILYGKP